MLINPTSPHGDIEVERSSSSLNQSSGHMKRHRFRGRVRYHKNESKLLPPKIDGRAISTGSKQNLLPTRCDTNEIFLDCGPNCPETCEQDGIRRKRCRGRCRRGCFCKPGYIRHQKMCILKDNCPGIYLLII